MKARREANKGPGITGSNKEKKERYLKEDFRMGLL
jgi:hypothetical protein